MDGWAITYAGSFMECQHPTLLIILMDESLGVNGKDIQGVSIYKAGDVAHIWWGGFHRDVWQPQCTEFGNQRFEIAMGLVGMLSMSMRRYKAYANNHSISYSHAC